MKKHLIVIIFLTLSGLNISSVYILKNVNASGLADSPWPCYQGNIGHTGLSQYDTSHLNGTIKWELKIVSGTTSPVIGPDDTIYIGGGSNANRLYAINPNGTIKWNFQVGYRVLSTPAISSDGTIYFVSEYLQAFLDQINLEGYVLDRVVLLKSNEDQEDNL